MAEQAETSVSPVEAGNTASAAVEVSANAEATKAEDAGGSPENGQPEATKPEEPKQDPAKGFLKRIDKLTAEKHRLRSEMDELRREVEALRNATTKPEMAPTDPDERIAWLARQEAQKLIAEQTRQQTEQTARAEAMRQAQERAQKMTEKYPDYAERLQEFDEAGYSLAEDVGQAIGAQSNAAEIAYYIATHPEEAAALAPNAGTPASRLYALMRLQAKAEASQPAQAPKVVTAAPAPTPVQRGSGGVTSLADMSFDDYHKMRLKQRNGR